MEPMTGGAGFVVPHAGYRYSGPVAAHAFHRIGQLGFPEVVVLLGPNHYGAGYPLAVSPAERWSTPLGELKVDADVGKRLMGMMPGLVPDVKAHLQEHSLEVQLPFLVNVCQRSPTIVPIVMADQSLKTSQKLGEGLASMMMERDLLILASSDLSHFLPDDQARQEDSYALAAIQSLDVEGLFRVVQERKLTMCGPGPVMTLLAAFRVIWATDARLLAYGTSGVTSQDRTRVVGYCAVEVKAG